MPWDSLRLKREKEKTREKREKNKVRERERETIYGFFKRLAGQIASATSSSSINCAYWSNRPANM